MKRELTYGERIRWFINNYYETGMEYEGLLSSMKDENLDSFKWYDEIISIPKYKFFAEPTLETFQTLEENNVFIHYSPDHYKDGSNLMFSIEFVNQKTQTSWYNDNHEFGNVLETIKSSIELALWYLEDPNRIDMINSGYHVKEYSQYIKDKHEFLESLYGK